MMRIKAISMSAVVTCFGSVLAAQACAETPLLKKGVCDRHGYTELARADETRMLIRQKAKAELEAEGWTCGNVTHDIVACPGVGNWDANSVRLFESAICGTNSKPEYAFFYVIHEATGEIGEPKALYFDHPVEHSGGPA